MNSKSPTQYHNGLIDIFKLHKVIELNVVNVKKKGEVNAEMVIYNNAGFENWSQSSQAQRYYISIKLP
jgi:hypothetical protein